MGHVLMCSPYGTEGEMKSVLQDVKMVERCYILDFLVTDRVEIYKAIVL